MRVYHRLIHLRNQQERHEDIPEEITSHPVFQLTNKFRLHVQNISKPITKTSPLKIDAEAMQIFAELAAHLRSVNSMVMIYLVACILEDLFGAETIENIEALRHGLSIQDIIDGNSIPLTAPAEAVPTPVVNGNVPLPSTSAAPITRSATEWLSNNFGPTPTQSAFFGKTDTSQPTTNVFGSSPAIPSSQPAPAPAQSAFANLGTTTNALGEVTSVFNGPTFGTTSAFGPNSAPSSAFGGNAPKSAFGQILTPPATGLSSAPAPPSPFGQPTINEASRGGIFSQPLTTNAFASESNCISLT